MNPGGINRCLMVNAFSRTRGICDRTAGARGAEHTGRAAGGTSVAPNVDRR